MTLTAELELALAATRAAGEAVMPWFRANPEVRHKTPDQPVTAADLEADAILRERLSSARPGYGWLSEESVDRPDRLERSRVWIVDPIDGTRSFIAGYREFAVSVALVEDGEAVVGVVYNPAREEVYWATRGGGAFRARHWHGGSEAGEALRMADPLEGRTPALLASRSEIAAGEFESFEGEWHIRPWGSAAYKLAGVAAGAGDGFISRGPKSEWDVAAGSLIVAEAGGRVTDLLGRPPRYNRSDPYVHGIVAAAPVLHGRLMSAAEGLPAPRLRSTH